MQDPKDIVDVYHAGIRTGVGAVVALELVVVGLIFVDTSKVRTLLANTLDTRWTPFRKKTKSVDWSE